MEYKIICNDVIIAEFINEHDRNICLELLAEYYDDCEFTTEVTTEVKLLGETNIGGLLWL